MHSASRLFPIRRKGLLHHPLLFSQASLGIRLSSALTASSTTPSRRSVLLLEFEEEVEKELLKLPAKQAEEARRKLRGDRSAERNGQHISRHSPLIIPYIPPYEGPTPDCSKGLWTHLIVGWRKNMLKEAWGQWLGSRQSRRAVDSVLSASNRAWMSDFMSHAHDAVSLFHMTLASGDFANPRTQKYFHENMIQHLEKKRETLLRAFSSSHFVTWKSHRNPASGALDKGRNAATEKEVETVAMRAAPFDKYGTIVQIAVRFRTFQSLEVRDERGILVYGSHEKPQLVMEYFIFQKRMSVADEPFLLFRQVYEDQKPHCLPV